MSRAMRSFLFALCILAASFFVWLDHNYQGRPHSLPQTTAEIVSDELAEIMIKVNSGKGTIGRLIQDSSIAENLSQTMVNIKKSSKGLNENMQASKHNFLLRGFFKKKAKADQKTKDSIESIKEKEQKAIDKKKK